MKFVSRVVVFFCFVLFLPFFYICNKWKWKIMWKPVNNGLPECVQAKSLFNSSAATNNGYNSTKFIHPFYRKNIGKNR